MQRLGLSTLAFLMLAGLFTAPSAQIVWESRNPVTQGNQLNGVVWAHDKYVAVGANNTVVTSPDGITWTTRVPPSPAVATTKWNAVAYNANRNLLVAVGEGGFIMTSENYGINWTIRRSGGTTNVKLYGVAISDNHIVVVGESSTILTSTNGGVDWVTRLSGVTASHYAVGYSPTLDRFVAVGTLGSIISSADGGENWANHGVGGTSLHSIVWTNTEFIVGGLNGRVFRSSNGTSGWALTTVSGSPVINGLAYGTEAVGVAPGGTVLTSSGTAWTAQTRMTNLELTAVTYNPSQNKYLAVGFGGVVLSSSGSNGTVWKQESSVTALLLGIDSGNGVRAAVGIGGAIMTSTDDITWLPRFSPTTKNLNAVTWNGSGFTAVGDGGVAVYSDALGANWTLGNTGVTYNLGSVTYVFANTIGRLIAGSSAKNVIISSTNSGQTWAAHSGANAHLLNGLATGGANPTSPSLVGVGFDEDNATASIRRIANVGVNGATANWSTVGGISATDVLYAVAWVGTRYIAVGAKGLIMSSPDGGVWTTESSPVSVSLWSVTRVNSTIVITGSNGTVLTSPISPAGSGWEQRSSGSSAALRGVTWSGSLITAVGTGGTIITSSPTAVPPVPTLVSPAGNATGVMVSPILKWSSSIGATQYNVQVSTSPTFATFVTNENVSAPSTQRQIGATLALNTQYYWRVSAIGSTGPSAFSDVGSFTVIGAAGSAPTTTTPAEGATGVSIFTSLSWNAYTPAATGYHVQLSRTSDFSGTLDLDDANTVTGTTRSLGELLPNTQYYWRIKAFTGVGISAWSATATFRTAPPLPGMPTLVSPANGVHGNVTSQNLTWSAPSGAVSSYRLQVSTNSGFSGTLFFDDSLTATNRNVTGLTANTEYFWRVRAKNDGGVSGFTAARSFSTWTAAPTATGILLPANGATNVDVFTEFTWNGNQTASTLRLQVARDTNFTNMVFDSIVTGTRRSIGQLNNTTKYFFRIAAINPVGTTYTVIHGFTTGSAPTTPPVAPALVSPANLTFDMPTTVNLSWSSSLTAKRYRLQIATTPAFDAGTVTLVDSTLTGLSRSVSGLAGSTEYYWKVDAWNNVGWSSGGQVRMFKTVVVAPTGVPTPLLPEMYAGGVSNTPLFTWTLVPGAASYKLQISLGPEFSTLVRNDSNIADTTRLSPALAYGTTYYWRVQARNSVGAGGYSLTMRFGTGAAPVPGAFALVSPQNYALEVPAAATFRWNRSQNATQYQLKICVAQALTPPCIVNDSMLTDTSKAVTGLALGASYFWRVTSRNSAGTAESETRRFAVTTDPNSAILFGRLGSREGLHVRAGELRFGLVQREKVRMRFLDIRGRDLAPAVTRVMEGGYHAVKLPEELHGTFFFVRFEAGLAQEMIKVHP